MKFELHAAAIVKEEIEKSKKALLLHKKKAQSLRRYIAEREADELKKKLH